MGTPRFLMLNDFVFKTNIDSLSTVFEPSEKLHKRSLKSNEPNYWDAVMDGNCCFASLNSIQQSQKRNRTI